jgi:hypothetical protein
LSRGIFGRKLHNSEYLQNRPASRNAMRKDDVLVELAVIKKDLPHWTDEVIEQWLLMLANRGTDTVGIRPSRWETTPGNTFSAHADARQGGLSTGLVSTGVVSTGVCYRRARRQRLGKSIVLPIAPNAFRASPDAFRRALT